MSVRTNEDRLTDSSERQSRNYEEMASEILRLKAQLRSWQVALKGALGEHHTLETCPVTVVARAIVESK